MEQQNSLQHFDVLKAKSAMIAQPAMLVQVKCGDSMAAALETGKSIKKLITSIEDTRKQLVAPHNEHVKKINAYAKMISEDLLRGETHLKKQLTQYSIELENERRRIAEEALKKEREEKARIEAEAAKKREEAEFDAMFTEPSQGALEVGLVNATADREMTEATQATKDALKQAEALKVSGTQKRWVFELTDLAQVPREYLILDEKEVRAAIKAGVREIPGIRIYQDTSISLRGN